MMEAPNTFSINQLILLLYLSNVFNKSFWHLANYDVSLIIFFTYVILFKITIPVRLPDFVITNLLFKLMFSRVAINDLQCSDKLERKL